LLPIDFSPLSYAALPMVAAIAEKFRAEIYLLHVVESGKHLDPKQQAKEYELFERLKDRLSEEWQLPQEFAHIETKKFVRHHLGSPGYGILEFAQDWDIDLITMATHGRSGLSRVMLGSVTEKVLKISPCPVLSIRSQFTNTKRIF
jgi:nucleotide-binding universal stress UspA family protein